MSYELITQMILLFGLIIVGYVCNKGGILDATSNAKFSTFLLKAALPATIVNSALSQDHLDKLIVLRITVVALGVFIIIPVLSKFIAKIFHLNSTYQLMLNYSNLGFMGLPIISSVFGEQYIFYGAVFMMVFNIHIFSFGIITIQGKPDSFGKMAKKLITPGIIAAVLAFIIVLANLKVPEPVQGIIASVGTVTTPLAMIVIGSQLAQVKLLAVLKKKELYFMSLLKLVVYPAIVYGLFYLIIGDCELTRIAAILTGLPVAGNVTMLSSEYGGDTALAAEGTGISTILSMATISIMLMLLAK